MRLSKHLFVWCLGLVALVITNATFAVASDNLLLATATADAMIPTDEPTSAATDVAANQPKSLDWPLAIPTEKQIAEARACDPKKLLVGRTDATIDDPKAPVNPPTACDWAVVAVKYFGSGNEEPPIEGKRAFLKAVALNATFAFHRQLFSYFGSTPVVKAPPFSKSSITRLQIELVWSGGIQVHIGAIKYRIVITQANTKRPVVSGTLKTEREDQIKDDAATPVAADGPITGTIDTVLVQAVGPALTDLVPVKNDFSFVPCTDNYPDWHVDVTFKDGTRLKLVTNGSNVYFTGGPWETTIGKQKYVQYSAGVLAAIANIAKALKMPFGSTQGMYCGADEDVLELAYGTPAKR